MTNVSFSLGCEKKYPKMQKKKYVQPHLLETVIGDAGSPVSTYSLERWQ